jgi:5-methylcytosine-specific restriction endonuclease McrA
MRSKRNEVDEREGPSKGLDGSLCAHPDGCALANGLPRPAVARWKGETPYCRTHYQRARRTGGDPGPAGLKRKACAPAPCCICGGKFHRGYKGRPYCSTHFARASKSPDDDPGAVERIRRESRPCSRCGGDFRRYIEGEPLCEPCSQARRYELNREAEKARSARYWAENRDRLLEASIARAREWRRDPANADRIRAAKAAYRAQNRERRRRYGRERWRVMARTVSAELLGVIRADPCAYCGSRAEVTVDHIESLAAGGLHAPENLAPACRSCNSSKKERPLLLFLLERAEEQSAAAAAPLRLAA